MTSNQKSWFQGLLARRHTLPGRLLVLAALFVIVMEVFLFIPSVSQFRYEWLQERIERAYLVALAIGVSDASQLDSEKIAEIFDSAQVMAISLDAGGVTSLIKAPTSQIDPTLARKQLDLRETNAITRVPAALIEMFTPGNAYFMVKDNPEGEPDVTIELFLEKAPLQAAMWQFGQRVLILSLMIAAVVAVGIYFSLMNIFVRPMMRLTDNMAHFQRDPEDIRSRMRPSGRYDEIGKAERVLAEMQEELRASLRQKTRLATLGEGVAKINHDLRNVLASAVLMSDRLGKSDDPRVQKLSPRLIGALDKAVAMCKATLDYGQTDVTDKSSVNLFDLAEEASDGLKLFSSGQQKIIFINNMPPNLVIIADKTQLFRALFNLARNAAEALTNAQTLRPKVQFVGYATGDKVIIEIHDNGPGMPEEAQENLFTPFKGSRRSGGSGLGLAIAAETVRAHGGVLSLKETGEEGTVFRIILPRESAPAGIDPMGAVA